MPKKPKAKIGPSPDVLAVAEAKQEILKLQKEIATRTLKLAAEVENVANKLSFNALAFLATECRLPRADIPKYLKFSGAFDEWSQAFPDRWIPAASMMAIADSDQRVRETCLATISAGTMLDSEHIVAIARNIESESVSGEDRIRQERQGALEARAATFSKAMLKSMDEGVNELLDMIYELFNEHLQLPDGGGDPFAELAIHLKSAKYRELHCAIRAKAITTLERFESLFGREQLPRNHWPRELDAVDADDVESETFLLAKAHLALKRFAAGEFGHKGGFVFHKDADCPYQFDIWEALSYLSPDPKPWAPVDCGVATAPPFRLSALEICAGAGGQAIGLHGAGFDAHALFEIDADAVATLRRNWPKWKVYQSDITKQKFGDWHGVDLLAGGIPCLPYTRGGSGLGKEDERDLLRETVRIVGEVEPRAFFFENVDGLMFGRHTDHRADVENAFHELGYQVAIQTIDGSEFGTGQARKRIVIVGLRPDAMPRFKMPEAIKFRGLAEVLEDLMMVHRLPEKDRPKVPADARWEELNPAERFESWAANWMKEYGGKQSPTLASIGETLPTRSAEAWLKVGLKMGKPAAEAPRVSDITSVGFIPTPTMAMLQRLQDFPAEWRFEGEWQSQLQQIVNAFPPTVARAIGLSIYTALTGIRFDTAKALEDPALFRHLIGKPLSLLSRNASMTPEEDELALIGAMPSTNVWSTRERHGLVHDELFDEWVRSLERDTAVDARWSDYDQEPRQEESPETGGHSAGTARPRRDWRKPVPPPVHLMENQS